MKISKPIERWFSVPNDPAKARVLIRHLRPGEIQDIVDSVLVQEVEYVTGEDGKPRGVIRQKNDTRQDREKTIVACVKDWEKFFDEKDKVLKCNEKNIVRAIREIDGFAGFVAECRKTLSKEMQAEFEAQKKT